ncbi:MAG TPA: universal stress protein [Nitrospira sp.]|nr:universal stress protein [Nitrospira sp.]
MTAPSTKPTLPFTHIFHPTDFSDDSHTALVHALKLASLIGAELTIMHIDPEVGRADFEDFPRVEPILERWKATRSQSTRTSDAETGFSIKNTRATAKNPTTGILEYLTKHPADLLVMATHQYDGLERWQHQTVAEPVARRSHVPTLFVPTHVEGIVVEATGQSKLRRALIPVSDKPNPQVAVDLTAQLASTLSCERLTGLLVHVGNDPTLHSLTYPARKGLVWRTMECHGNIVDVILGTGADFDVDLIVMATEGHNSLLDTMRGSTTERVLRGARCPLLALPASH